MASRLGAFLLVLAVVPWVAGSRPTTPVLPDEASLRAMELACADGLKERLPSAAPVLHDQQLQLEPLDGGRYLLRSLLRQGQSHRAVPFLCEAAPEGGGFRAVGITLIEW